jgi:retron-type reverse transcriptase
MKGPTEIPIELLHRRGKASPSLDIRSKLRFDEQGRCVNAFQVLNSPDMLKLAYETIKSNPGNMVRGSDNETLDGITDDWFRKTSRDLIAESYRPKPARRVYFPKANGKLRPLGISSPRDKIVQQSVRIVMEEVLNPNSWTPHMDSDPNEAVTRLWRRYVPE